jgi:hypothetical protein
MSFSTIMDLVMPEQLVKAVLPVKTVFGGESPRFVSFVQDYTQSGSCGRLVLQAAVTPAAQGQKG